MGRLLTLSCLLVLSLATSYAQTRTTAKKQAQTKAAAETEGSFRCYLPPNCYKPANPAQLPLSTIHARLEGKVFVKFIVDSTLTIRDMTIACARLKWKRTGRSYAPDCQHLTPAQQQELGKLAFPLVRRVKMVANAAAPRSRCQSEMLAVPVTVL